jgi:hypothetical protein
MGVLLKIASRRAKRRAEGGATISGSNRQLLIHKDPELIKEIKLAGTEREETASSLAVWVVKE